MTAGVRLLLRPFGIAPARMSHDDSHHKEGLGSYNNVFDKTLPLRRVSAVIAELQVMENKERGKRSVAAKVEEEGRRSKIIIKEF